MEEFIKFINFIEKQNLNDELTIQNIINYNKKNKIKIDWLNNNKIIFNHTERHYIIKCIKQVLDNNFIDYYDYERKAKKLKLL